MQTANAMLNYMYELASVNLKASKELIVEGKEIIDFNYQKFVLI